MAVREGFKISINKEIVQPYGTWGFVHATLFWYGFFQTPALRRDENGRENLPNA
jgi:hypothetical protein